MLYLEQVVPEPLTQGCQHPQATLSIVTAARWGCTRLVPPAIAAQGDPSTRPPVVQSPLPMQAVLAKQTLIPQRGEICALALPFLRAPSRSEVTRPATSLSPALSDNTWLSKAWFGRHQSTQLHCQAFLQGGKGAARESDGPSCKVLLPSCPAAEGEQRPP